jgi:hypothetical protein
VTVTLTPKYLTKFIALLSAESMPQKKKLHKDIYKHEETSGMEKIENVNHVEQSYQFIMMRLSVNRV